VYNKEVKARSAFSGRVEEGDGFSEGDNVRRGEVRDGGGSSHTRGEEFGFKKVETDAMKFAKFVEVLNKDSKVKEGKDNGNIIEEGDMEAAREPRSSSPGEWKRRVTVQAWSSE
jgi:hypothetical protein